MHMIVQNLQKKTTLGQGCPTCCRNPISDDPKKEIFITYKILSLA